MDYDDGGVGDKWGEPVFSLWPQWANSSATYIGPVTQVVLDEVPSTNDT